MKTVAILGTVGVPGAYGGFETLAENLVRFHERNDLEVELVVYCSANTYPNRPSSFLGAELRYVALNANGVSSIPYDIVSLFSAVWRGSDVILLLGVSGALMLPLVRLLSRARIVTNIDGVEWKREKWKGAARWFLRLSERMAVRFSHEVIADNAGIANHVSLTYGRDSHVIAYGGDHALQAEGKPFGGEPLLDRYALAICRIEPENNISLILEAFARADSLPLVCIGNWNNSEYGRELKRRYATTTRLRLLDPIYDLGVLHTLRSQASVYVHGHSAGGTNPSLVEMMHFGVPVMAYDCEFNRYTTDGKALWFCDVESLGATLDFLTPEHSANIGAEMKRIAQERFTWGAIGLAYFNLLLGA
ncbi:DUF1972 domain-containing protein [Gammaproteobacteria bacterium]|nr:DUF1972 domain-containing protein [Gammaproteobacteria bacterium]